MTTVFLGLGSNLGEREKNIQRGIKLLTKNGVFLHAKSSLYLTKPMYFSFQPSFLNLVIKAKVFLSPENLLNIILAIERKLGRFRFFKNTPRVLDIDILFYGDRVINSKFLKIPHPRIPERPFVLFPLREIEPNLIHPVIKKTIDELAKNISPKGVVLWKR